ncbi:MAG: class I SAM-dependent methyltransferase [candidate division Zixibacteria bacterium]|nr:class I SAM-dependent methyltransferase [candidate division Zixibacteria bacterium]
MANKDRVCPWWMGYFIDNPIRRFFQNPTKIINPYLKSGMRVLDIGCGMGIFSIASAEIVGAEGKVYSVDLQKRMLNTLIKRASRKKVADRIETKVCKPDSLDLNDLSNSIDFAIAFYMVHEVPDKQGFFKQVSETMKQGAKILIAEPQGHVTDEKLEITIDIAKSEGFELINRPDISRSRSALLKKI